MKKRNYYSCFWILMKTMILIFIIVSCSPNKNKVKMNISTFIDNTNGLNLIVENNQKYLKISEEFSTDKVESLISVFRDNRIDFEFYDIKYPSPSEPGAYFSYSLNNAMESDKWNMTLGNHGWSGGIYQIPDSTIVIQLHDLVRKKLLKEIKISNETFYSHYEFEKEDANQKKNELIQNIHMDK